MRNEELILVGIQDLEINCKYLFLVLMSISIDNIYIEEDIGELITITGLKAGQIYRARSILAKKNYIKLEKFYCSKNKEITKVIYSLL
jgi:hypothetical protein